MAMEEGEVIGLVGGISPGKGCGVEVLEGFGRPIMMVGALARIVVLGLLGRLLVRDLVADSMRLERVPRTMIQGEERSRVLLRFPFDRLSEARGPVARALLMPTHVRKLKRRQDRQRVAREKILSDWSSTQEQQHSSNNAEAPVTIAKTSHP